MTLADQIKATLRDVPDFPKPGILFKDITPVLGDGALFAQIIASWQQRYAPMDLDAVVGIESRGFVFGAPLAVALGLPFVMIRKPGKLPADKVGVDYALEYGTDRVEMHADALGVGDRVVIVDDLLATGGTAKAAHDLVEEVGARVVECAFLVELAFLEGAKRLGTPIHAEVTF